MITTGLHLLGFIVAGTLAAEESAKPAAAFKTSERLKTEIRAHLPNYVPAPPPKDINQLGQASVDADPDRLTLPKFTVREKYQPRIVPEELLSRGELNKKYARTYRETLTPGLDAFLNSFTIPIFSPSPAERGRFIERQRRISDINHIARLGREHDPDNSASLKSTLNDSLKAMEHVSRPAGDGRKN